MSDREKIGCPCCGKEPGALEDDCFCNRAAVRERELRAEVEQLREALAIAEKALRCEWETESRYAPMNCTAQAIRYAQEALYGE